MNNIISIQGEKRYHYSEAEQWYFRLMNDPEYFEKERYIDSINVYSSIIEEFQKMYDRTPVANRTARNKILNGMETVRRREWIYLSPKLHSYSY
jgi:hypothetical protein